jgi:hypothetical protein
MAAFGERQAYSPVTRSSYLMDRLEHVERTRPGRTHERMMKQWIKTAILTQSEFVPPPQFTVEKNRRCVGRRKTITWTVSRIGITSHLYSDLHLHGQTFSDLPFFQTQLQRKLQCWSHQYCIFHHFAAFSIDSIRKPCTMGALSQEKWPWTVQLLALQWRRCSRTHCCWSQDDWQTNAGDCVKGWPHRLLSCRWYDCHQSPKKDCYINLLLFTLVLLRWMRE